MRYFLALLAIIILSFGSSVKAQETCVKAISNAIDISKTIKRDEQGVMFNGMADALIEVSKLTNLSDGIYLNFYVWSVEQEVVIDWTLVRSEAELVAFAEQVRLIPERITIPRFGTGLYKAMGFGRDGLINGPQCSQHILDIVTDGVENMGREDEEWMVRDSFPEDYEINVLVIGGDVPHTLPNGDKTTVGHHLEDNVISRWGFILPITSFESFREAFYAKIQMEMM